MKSLIVGCSITHGSELVSDTYHPDNVINSYANLLSNELGYLPNNIAIPGNSNDRIFHDAVSNLLGYDLLIVGWTSLVRESWRNCDLDYFFNPNWACATNDLTMSSVWVEYQPIKTVSSDKHLINELQIYHKFAMLYKSDQNELMKKIHNYRVCLKNLCLSNNIKFIDICLIDHLFEDCYFFDVIKECNGRHPNKEQHLYIKDQVKKKYTL